MACGPRNMFCRPSEAHTNGLMGTGSRSTENHALGKGTRRRTVPRILGRLALLRGTTHPGRVWPPQRVRVLRDLRVRRRCGISVERVCETSVLRLSQRQVFAFVETRRWKSPKH